MGSKAQAADGSSRGDPAGVALGRPTRNQTPGEKIRDNFLQFTNSRPNVQSDGMIIGYPDGPDLDRTAGINYGFDQTMSDLLAGARSSRNNSPPSQTMPPVMFEGPPSRTMPPVFIPPQASPNRLFKQSELDNLETVQLPPSVRDESAPIPGIDIPLNRFFPLFPEEKFPIPMPPPRILPQPFDLRSPTEFEQSEKSNIFLDPLLYLSGLNPASGLGYLFREYLSNQQED